MFTSADRALIAIVYLRQICSQLVLSEMLEVSTGPFAEAITETGKVLAERRHRIEPTVLRFTSGSAAGLPGIRHRPEPAIGSRPWANRC